MFLKGVEVLVIIFIIFINETQTGQPKKNDVTRKKPQAQGNNKAKYIPQTTRWPGDIKKNKPQSKLNPNIKVQKKVLKSKSNPGNKLKTSKPQTNQRKNLPKNKPKANIKQKGNMPMKIPQTKQRISTPKNKQGNKENNISKNKPPTNELSNIPKNVPAIKPEYNVLKDIASTLNRGDYWPKHALQSNPWNIISKNIPQTNPRNNAPKNILASQDNKVTKDTASLKLNQEKNMLNNISQTNQRKNVPNNKPKANIKQKGNMPIKIPQTKQTISIPKNKQGNQENNISKNKPPTNELSNIPKNVPGIKPEYNVLKDIPSTLNRGNYWPKHALQSNPWNIISKNIPQTNPGNNAPKNILASQDNKVTKDTASLKLNQEKNMLNNISQTKPGINISNDKPQLEKEGVRKKKWNFQDYLKKFEPKTIWEQIDKQRKYNGRQISEEEQTEIMIRGIDPTDEIMKLKVENGDAKMISQADARRGWKPSPGLHWFELDRFHLRRRLYELMKQAIYQTRNKMITMQIIRNKYRRNALYKMGFLFNKADNAANIFGKFSFRAFRNCLLKREALEHPLLFNLLTTNERQLNLWFNVEIIADLIKKNDAICKELFQKYKSSRNQMFDEHFVD